MFRELLPFVGAVVVLAVTATAVVMAIRWRARLELDPRHQLFTSPSGDASHAPEDLRDPDFLALGLGGTNMMAMLWSIAAGRRAIGIELRGDPSLGIHWNIREDLYHHFGLIDRMMAEQYGEDRLPRRRDGAIFRLRETFYGHDSLPGDVYADEVLSGYPAQLGEESHISGLVHHAEFIDDRWRDGTPHRVLTILPPAQAPQGHDPSKVGRDVREMLDGPSTFQAGASEVLIMLRRYLEGLEEMDLAAGVPPRARLFTSHRVTVGREGSAGGFLRWLRQDRGFVSLPDGRKRVFIEEVQELDHRGRFHRVRKPGTSVIDLGVPKLFMIAQGFDSSDADRLGFRQEDVEIDHRDGRGPVVAQADYLAGFIDINVGARLRRRIASEFDREGNEYWVRQLAVGHEDDPEVGWILVQVPDFKTFDPILAGLVPAGTPKVSKQYVSAYQQLIREYYLEQVSLVTELPLEEVARIEQPYGPKLFSMVERVGADAQVAANGVVAGDSFGNGHFLTSGGAMTGMVGHGHRVLRYWQATDAGTGERAAIRELAEGIRKDTHDWLATSAQEFSQALPINLGRERGAEIQRRSARGATERAHVVDATRRHRHSLVPLDPSDWRRLVVRAGRLRTHDLPPLMESHPDLRQQSAPTHPAPAATPQSPVDEAEDESAAGSPVPASAS